MAALLAVFRSETVQLLVNLCSQIQIADKMFEALSDRITRYTRNEVAEAYIFYTRVEGKPESISDCVVSLK